MNTKPECKPLRIDITGGTPEQRNALDQARADGKREALSAVLVEIDKLATNSIYERAGKRIAIAIIRMLRAVNETITQA